VLFNPISSGAALPGHRSIKTVSALRFFYGATLGHQVLPVRIPYARCPKRVPIVLSPEEIVRFLEAIDDRKSRVALIAAYGCGLRVSEAAALRVQDIDNSRMVIRVESGKGGKQRYVMLPETLLEILWAYWLIERPRNWLFPGRDGQNPINTTTLNTACRLAVAAAGLSKRVTPHTMRHCFATHLLEQGTNIRIIQALFGHTSIATPARYTSVATTIIAATQSPLDRLTLTVPEASAQDGQIPPT
jgi:integrase/recombinase XerD